MQVTIGNLYGEEKRRKKTGNSALFQLSTRLLVSGAVLVVNDAFYSHSIVLGGLVEMS